jgi:hypothetical protein
MGKIFICFVLLCAHYIPSYGQQNAVARFQELTASNRTKMYLGYDPCIEYIPDISHTTNNINVYLHGWKENKYTNLRKSLFIPPAVIFDFPDARRDKKVSLRHASFGQKADILPTIFVLNAIIESGLAQQINFIGFSKGGATAINTIALLNKPKSYKKDLASLHIDYSQCHAILQALKRGIIILDCPLKHVNYGIEQQVQKYSSSFIDNIPDNPTKPGNMVKRIKKHLLACIDYICSVILEYIIFPLYTCYAPWREQPINTVDDWPSESLTTIIRYDACDHMVSNNGDIPFYQKIHNKNPLRTFLVTSNQCGGHCSHCQDLFNLFMMLNKPSHTHTADLLFIIQYPSPL